MVVLLGGPLVLALVARRGRDGGAVEATRWDGRLMWHSLLLCVLAFNLTFFLQEFFLVLPKAFVPGLNPTLYHNNHSWTGTNPLARLFQGTGALAILLSGLTFATIVWRSAPTRPALRLFFLWMVYHGVLQALPQIIAGTLGQGDVGMAMGYLKWSEPLRLLAAFAALLGIVFTGMKLTGAFLGIAADSSQLAEPRARTKFMANVVTAPAFLSPPLIFIYRVPREAIEVIVPPILVMVIGCAWLQANAARVKGVQAGGAPGLGSPRTALLACLGVLAFFQLVLRSGVKFY